MLLSTLIALSFFGAAGQGDRITLVGAFVEHRYCRTWESDGYCPCADGSSPTYWVESPNGNRHRVVLDAEIMDQYFGTSALNGKFVRIRGQQIAGTDGIVRMKSLELLRPEFIKRSDDPNIRALAHFATTTASDQYTISSTEIRKYLNIMVKFQESTHEEFPAPYYQEMMRSTYPGLDHWVREASYGLVGIASQSVGWITLPKSKDNYLDDSGGEWDVNKIMADALPMVDSQVAFDGIWGVNVFVNMDPPAKPGGAYATWSHLVADGVDRWFPITLEKLGAHTQNALGHEDGHNFGNDHSSGPYNTPYDSMWDVNSGGAYWASSGFGYGPTTAGIPYNAYHKKMLGWIPKERVYYAYPGTSQTVYIDRLTQPSSSASYLMAKVYFPGYATKYFTVESRKKVGYDEGIPGEGVIIHDCDELRKVTDLYGGPRYDRASQVVDPDNNGNPNDAGAIWVAGEEYVSASTGIHIKVVSATPTGYNVQITVPAKAWSPGEVTSTASAGPYTLREALRYTQEFPAQPVRFRIPLSDPGFSAGVARIKLTEPLQDLTTDGVVIDGTTQTTNIGNTNPYGPEIFIDGSGILDDQNQPRYAHGVVVKAPNITLKGLAVGSFYASGIYAETAGAKNLRVSGCYLGLHPNGTSLVGNGWDGISLANGMTGALIGGTTLADRNIISGNSNGVNAYGVGTTANRIVGNFFGTNYSGSVMKNNMYNAVNLGDHARANDVGGLSSGERNLIVGTVTVRDDGTDDNHVLGNYIGCDAAGTTALNMPGGWGIALRYGVKRTIIRGNTVSGNGSVGIGVVEPTSSDNQIVGNIIGLNPAGTGALPNGTGIYVTGGANATQIGGSSPADRNIISGNTSTAIAIENSPNTRVQGNYVGLSVSGLAVIPNQGWAIQQWGTSEGSVFGGTTPGQGNFISGNAGIGLAIRSGTASVLGNTIGLTVNGSLAGNQIALHIDGTAHNCIIGGASAAAGNVLVGSREAGLVIRDAGTNHNSVKGNWIGVDRNGVPKPNAADGVWMFGGTTTNTIGGPTASEGNVIAHNGQNGIALYDAASTGNAFRGNQIYANNLLGINLGGGDGAYGVTSNDNLDVDMGPNGLQNFPELGSGVRTATGTTITGWLNSAPGRSYAVDVFVSDAVDDSGFGEGQRFLGTISVTTNSSGFATFGINTGVATGSWLSATATDIATGDSSEFSQAIALDNGVVGLTLNPASVNNGNSTTATVSLGAVAPNGGAYVTLSSNNQAASVPASMIIPEGQISGTFTVNTFAVPVNTSVTITANYDGTAKSANLTVIATVALKSFTLSPTTVNGGTNSVGIVVMNGVVATGGLTVSMSEGSAYVNCPTSAFIAAGSTATSFAIPTVNPPSNQSVVINATLGSVTKTATLTVLRAPNVNSLTVVPNSVVGGHASVGTVTLDMAAPPSGATVILSDSSAYITTPPNIVFSAGATTRSFSILTSAVTVAQTQTITASLNGTAKTATLQLLPAVYLVSLTITPSTVKGGLTATGQVTLNAGAPIGGATVVLSHTILSVTMPASVTISPGTLSKTFTITTPHVLTTYTSTVTAKYVGVIKTSTLTITP